jgi:transcriptional regulator GlxA family with amidase domain
MPCPPESANDFAQLQFHHGFEAAVYSSTKLGQLPAVAGPDRNAKRQDPLLLRRLLRAKDRMDAASSEAWPVSRLARVSGVSEAHFARSFKDAFGLPPHRYLLTRRIEQAAALLRDSNLPITEIALIAGWSSLGTFGRTFRDVTGESPSELRRRERTAGHQLDRVPHCFVSAAQRPNLTIAVLEKRRRVAHGMAAGEETEQGELP